MPEQNTEMRDFMIVLRRALLMLVRYIEKRYNLTDSQEGG